MKRQLEESRQPENLGNFVANDACESLVFAVLSMLTGLEGEGQEERAVYFNF